MHRFLLTEKDILKDSEVTIKNLQLFKQITQVLRFKIGDTLIFLPNNGTEIVAQISNIKNSEFTAEIIKNREVNTTPLRRTVLAQSLLKNLDRFEFTLQKGVELGFTDFIPLITSRTERVPKNKIQRWERIIAEATEQSGRTITPKLHPIQKISQLDTENHLLIVPHTHTVSTLSETHLSLREALSKDDRDIIILIGPEGGFTDEEISSLPEVVKISLGPRILRSETAGMVTITLINSILN